MAQLYRNRLVVGVKCPRCGRSRVVDCHPRDLAGSGADICDACGMEHAIRTGDLRLALEKGFRRAIRRVEAQDNRFWGDILAVTICNAALLLEPLLWVTVVRLYYQSIGHYVMSTLHLVRRMERLGRERMLVFVATPDAEFESNRYIGKKWAERLLFSRHAEAAYRRLAAKRPASIWDSAHKTSHKYLFRDLSRAFLYLFKQYDYSTLPHCIDLRDEAYKWYVDAEQSGEDLRSPFIFTAAERERAARELRGLGIENGRGHIVFLARDKGYYDRPRGLPFHFESTNHRNMDVNNFLPAMNWAVDNGIAAVRMGRDVVKALPDAREGIIDYASGSPTDFLDVHLVANCLFQVCANTGMYYLGLIFGKWLLACNFPDVYSPMDYAYFPRVCFMFKKFWCHRAKRFLSLREILARKLENKRLASAYFQERISLVENSGAEILSATRETYSRAVGTWRTTDAEEELQGKFKALLRAAYQEDVPLAGVVSHSFLSANPWLLADA
ncbi:MAG: TIGR04372 family glycosyltransferase [Planctomycetota bacterium]|nr:TIGR04372 family glycosyltransferase [Planctomycetota bacterium]